MGMRNVGLDYLTDKQRKLVEENIRLVYHQAHKRHITDEDLIQEGMLALVNAARFYSDEYGVKFSTYAASYIWSAFFGTYSDKKYKRNQAFTKSIDDPDVDIQLSGNLDPNYDFMNYLQYGSDPLSKKIVSLICNGYTKKKIQELLNISSSQLNSILITIGKENYGEKFNSSKYSNQEKVR